MTSDGFRLAGRRTAASMSPSREAASASAVVCHATFDERAPFTSPHQERRKSRAAIDPCRPADPTRFKSFSSMNNVIKSDRVIVLWIPAHIVDQLAALQHKFTDTCRSFAPSTATPSATLLRFSLILRCMQLLEQSADNSRCKTASKARDQGALRGDGSCGIDAHGTAARPKMHLRCARR